MHFLYQRAALILLIAAGFFFAAGGSAHAEGTTDPAQSAPFIQAVQHLKNDCENSAALQAILDVLKSGTERLDDPNRQAWLRVSDQFDYLAFLQARVTFYRQSNERIRSQLVANGVAMIPEEKLAAEPASITPVFPDGSADVTLFDRDPSAGLPVDRAADAVRDIQQQLVARLDRVQELNQRLRACQRERYQTLAVETQNSVMTTDRSLVKTLEEKEGIIDQQRQQIEDLEKGFQGVQHEVGGLRDQIADNNERIKQMTADLASLTLTSHEKDFALAERNQRLQDLEATVTETTERLRLVQKIIAEKDTYIQDLEQRIDQIAAIPTKATSVTVDDLKTEVNEIRSSMTDQAMAHEEQILELAAAVQQMADQYDALKIDDFKKTVIIQKMQGLLAERSDELARTQALSTSKDTALIQLRERVRQYRLKIAELTLQLIKSDGNGRLNSGSSDRRAQGITEDSEPAARVSAVDPLPALPAIYERTVAHVEKLFQNTQP